MAKVNANGEEGNPNGRGATQQPGQQPGLVPNGAPNGAGRVALPHAAHVAVVVANPVIANLVAWERFLLMHPQLQFDVEAALLGPPATKRNPCFDILPIIK